MDRHGLSERRACELADLHRSVFQYKKLDRGDEALRKRLRELANERRRFGYRRLGILLAREGFEVNHKKLFRLYREEGLAVRRRRSRKRALGTRRPILVPDRANQRWSLDFVSDAFADGIDDVGIDQMTAKDVLAKLQAAFVSLQPHWLGQPASVRLGHRRFRSRTSHQENKYLVRHRVSAGAATDHWKQWMTARARRWQPSLIVPCLVPA